MGTEEFWIPAVLAAVGSGAQSINQHNANSRADNAEAASIYHQQQIANEGTGQVKQLVNQISQDNPEQIAAQATGNYVSQLRHNAAGSTQGGSTTGSGQTFGGSVSALAPSVAGNSRYNTDTANSQKEVQDYGDTYAGEMGNLDAATRLRTNEGLAMNTLGTNLNTLNAQSQSQSFVDQLRAAAAGQANPWVNLVGGALAKGASAYAMGAGLGGTPAVSQTGAGIGGGAGGFAGMTQAGIPNVYGPLYTPA